MGDDQNGLSRPLDCGPTQGVIPPFTDAFAIFALGRTERPAARCAAARRHVRIDLPDRSSLPKPPFLLPKAGVRNDFKIERTIHQLGRGPGPPQIADQHPVPGKRGKLPPPYFRKPAPGFRQGGVRLALDSFFTVPDRFRMPDQPEAGCWIRRVHRLSAIPSNTSSTTP